MVGMEGFEPPSPAPKAGAMNQATPHPVCLEVYIKYSLMSIYFNKIII